DFIKKYIDLLAMHKMNTFHWHLVDDQGWRIEIKAYPLLTEKAAWREGTGTEAWDYFVGPAVEGKPKYGGFYTQEEIREVVQYAADRFITVVPEIEMPGHSRAALDAYPEMYCTGKPYERKPDDEHYLPPFCAGNDQSFVFLENILEEVLELFPSECIHIGGDEAPKHTWEVCPKCQDRMKQEGLADTDELQSYFITRMERFLNAKGRKIIGWDEILEGGLAPNAAVMSWRGTEGGIAAARSGHAVVMSPTSHCYFNYPHDAPTLDKIYAYEPIPSELNADQAKYILGAQGNVWTEGMITPTDVEHMALPRMSAMAEVVWSKKEHRDFDGFTKRMDKQYKRLDAMDVNYFDTRQKK
ncbi:MAG: family 20 glycosylhydrolase, partial [Verrucomicrobiota bacterium]